MRTVFLNPKLYLKGMKLKSQKDEVTLRALKCVQMYTSGGAKHLEYYSVSKHTPVTVTERVFPKHQRAAVAQENWVGEET